MLWRRRLEAISTPVFRAHARASRSLTLGVRGLVTDAEGRVLLIEHTYILGWYMPGGGVERGETAEHALYRELIEEAGVEAIDRPTLASVHDNSAKFPGDHVLIYRVNGWRPVPATSRGEIHDLGWFDPEALPLETTPSTRRRITEILGGAAPDPLW